MFILIKCYERDIEIVDKFETEKDAKIGLLNDMLLAFKEKDDDYYAKQIQGIKDKVINDKYMYFEDEDIGVFCQVAWWNGKGENYDWKICEI